MRTVSTNTVYLSDYLTVPMPTRAVSHRDYLRQVRKRRLLWALLPFFAQALAAVLLIALTVLGLEMFVIGMGGI